MPDPPGRVTDHLEPSEWPTHRQGGGIRKSASRCTFLAAKVTVELTEQGIPVLLGPVSEVLDKVLDLFTRGFPKRFHGAEIGRVRLDPGWDRVDAGE